MAALDLGVFLPTMSDPGERPGDVAAAARHAEDIGLESVWAVDQLVAGTGAPIIDSTVALAAAAAATGRVRLGFGVMILPLRPAVWAAKQVAALQHVSGDRVILGVGAGGDRHERSWPAAGVPRAERGRRTTAAVRVLPRLISGTATPVPALLGGGTVQLAPGATVPPIVVGGMSRAAMARAADHGDGWFLVPGSPTAMREQRRAIDELAAARGRQPLELTASLLVLADGDAARPDDDSVLRMLTDVDGRFAMPRDQVPNLLTRGPATAIADRLAQYAEAGADRVVVTFAAGNWLRQSELLAEARALLG